MKEKSEETKPDKLVQGPNQEWITVAEFDKLTKHGCANCQGNIDSADHLYVEWREGNQPLCLSCAVTLEGGK